jgi:hypothetical protein
LRAIPPEAATSSQPSKQYKVTMSGRRWYDGDGYGPDHNNVREAARNDGGPQYRDYQKFDRSTDYASRPKHSILDSESSSPPHRRPSPEHCTYRSYSPGSDYIDRPEESRSDYICPDTPASVRHASNRQAYDDKYDGGFSRIRSPVHYTRSREVDNRSDIDCSSFPSQKSGYQLGKEGGWDNKHDFMRSHGLKIWEDENPQVVSRIIHKYRDIDTQNEYASADGYRKRSGSMESDLAYRCDGSGYHGEDLDERASDIASYHSDAGSDRLSRASTAAESGVASQQTGWRSSDYASVPASGHGYTLPRQSSDSSDYAPIRERSSQPHSYTASSDDNGVAEGSDYMSSDDEQSDICRKPGSDGYVSDNGIGEGSDYVSSDDARSDVCSNPGSDGGSDKGEDEGDYMSDDREDCIEDDDYDGNVGDDA